MKYSLAIDIGASSGRHILGWLENGKIVTEEIYRFPNAPLETTENGIRVLRWDTERLFQEILRGLARAHEIGKIPESVGIDTWGVDYVLLDQNDQPLGNAYCYRDGRTAAAIPAVHAALPFETLYKKTGIQFATFNSLYQLYADHMTGRLEKAAAFLMLPDYFHFRLTGKKVQDITNATTTGMINASTHTWDPEILGLLGKPDIFLPPTAPGTKIGSFSDAVATQVGYNATVILPATHDTASAVVAAPLEGETPYISSGTWSLLGIEQERAHTDKASMTYNYSNEGTPVGTFRFQKNIMGLWLLQQVRHELNDRYSFAELTEMARNSPVNCRFDVNDDSFLAPESMIDAVTKAAGRNVSVGELAYAILDNLARSYAQSLEELESITGKTYPTLNIIGGGSRNALLSELTVKYTQKRILAGPSEGTAIGNLILQFLGRNEIPDISTGRRLVTDSFAITTY